MVVAGLVFVLLLLFSFVGLVSWWPLPALLALLVLWLRPVLPGLRALLLLSLVALLAALAPDGLLAGGLLWWAALWLLLLSSLRSAQGNERDRLRQALIWAAALHGLLVLVDALSLAGRGAGVLGNPNLAGSVLAMSLPLALSQRRWWVVVAITGGLLASASFGALLGLLLAGAWWTWHSGIWFRLYRQHGWRLALALLAGLLLLTAGMSAYGRVWWYKRPVIWREAGELFLAQPLTGIGLGQFRAAWQERLLADPDLARVFCGPAGCADFVHVHNLPLHVAAETGLIGLAVGVLALWWLWRRVDRTKRASPAMLGLIVLAGHSLVDVTLLHPAVAGVAVLLLALALPELSMTPAKRRPMLYVLAGALLFAAPLVWGFLCYLYG